MGEAPVGGVDEDAVGFEAGGVLPGVVAEDGVATFIIFVVVVGERGR